jgi:Rrf2 family nitric oxide-sensitive transcriptional repressor
MQLTRFTDLSLRVLMYLAWQPEGATANIGAMARAFSVPENHLVKVVHRLSKSGFVKTTRGRGGGVRLGRPRDEIRIGEVVRITEPGMELVDCEGPAPCPLRVACGLKCLLDGAVAAFLAKLDEVTLADLTQGDRGRRLLQELPQAAPSPHGEAV